MRIERLDLKTFGIFTNTTLDLSVPALHVIYGANEAGKSTARAAISNLLFGFGHISPYAFAHPLNRLELGARISTMDSKVIDVIRYKRDRDNLVESSSQRPVSQSEWAPFLQGVNQSEFDAMFTLGWKELLDGTAALISSGGTLGEALFAAGLGVRDLGSVLSKLSSDAEKLFTPRAQNRTVNSALKEAETARKEASTFTVRPTRYDTVRRDYDKVIEIRRKNAEERRRLDQEIERNATLRGVLPKLREREQKIDERDQLTSLGPVASASWAERIENALTSRGNLIRERSEASQQIGLAIEKLDGMQSDSIALEIADRVDALGEGIAAYVEGRSDRSGLEESRAAAERDALGVLKMIVGGFSDVIDLENIQSVVANRKLLVPVRDDWLTKESDSMQAQEKLSEAEDELEDVASSLAQLPAQIDMAPLRSAYEAILRRGDLDSALTVAETRRSLAWSEVLDGAVKVGVTEKGIGDFVMEKIPSENEVDVILTNIESLLAEATSADDRVQDYEQEIAGLETELTSLARESGLPTEDDLVRHREARDGRWTLIKHTWLEHHEVTGSTSDYPDDRALAASYEYAMSDADGTVDRLWREADRTARRENLLAQIERTQKERNRSIAQFKETRELATNRYKEWTVTWAGQSIPETHTALRQWTRNAQELRDLFTSWREAKVAHREAFRAVRNCRAQIVRLLADCGVAAEIGRDVTSVISLAKSFIADGEKCEADRKELTGRKSNVERRFPRLRKTTETAKVNLLESADSFLSLVAPYGSGITSPLEAGALLGQLDDLERHLKQRAELQDRINGIDGRSSKFEAEVCSLLHDTGEPSTDDPVATTRSLVKRVGIARKIEASRETLLASKAQAEDNVEAADAKLSGVAEELLVLAEEERITDLELLGSAAERAARVAILDDDITACDELLIQQGGGRSIQTLEDDAKDLDLGLISSEITSCQEARSELESLASLAEKQERDLEVQLREMDGSDKAARRSADARFKLDEAIEGAERYSRFFLARFIADEAIRRYTETHQDPVLTIAGQHLATLTDGAYVKAGVEEDTRRGALLSMISNTGEEKQLDELSSGTRDALYLALRLAALEATITRTGPMPIVLDDILVNFDERRSATALQCLASIAMGTQVLLFTHHQHIVDLAEQRLGENKLVVHRLTQSDRES